MCSDVAPVLHRSGRYLKKYHGCFDTNYGGISYMRYGSTIFNAGTVIGHLHENVDEPNGLAEIRPPVYKNEAGWKKDFERLMSYLKAYEQGMTREAYLRSYEMHNSHIF